MSEIICVNRRNKSSIGSHFAFDRPIDASSIYYTQKRFSCHGYDGIIIIAIKTSCEQVSIVKVINYTGITSAIQSIRIGVNNQPVTLLIRASISLD